MNGDQLCMASNGKLFERFFECHASTDQVTVSEDHDVYEWVDLNRLDE